ncbi:transmembrane protease serine 9-like [Branchiostoma floridae]|uniref:Transmembrane protease serine 9-like n=1 Tax=Branchiostoma floridae TaxID=7739 RepID=A0A9J7MWK5_BRAFL|nr:transmembrane protease serine 9-like [Branchiostoma floridae]
MFWLAFVLLFAVQQGGGSTIGRSSRSNDPNCGKASVGLNAAPQRIHGGQYATQGMFPWMVSLKNLKPENLHYKHYCGGTLYNNQWVITAAHCAAEATGGTDPSMWRVRAGLTSVVTWEDGREDYNVSRVILHPAYHEFTIGSQDVAHHDVALIKLASPITVNNLVNNICLPDSDAIPGTNCVVSGWGYHDIQNQVDGAESERLKWTYAPLLDPAYCSKDHVWGTLEVSSIQVCAGYEHGRDDACDGDSGGPLICPSPDGSRWELHGIVNWGEQPCGDPHKPTMYARVTAFKSWIEQTIQSN